jgi:tetratricopeptide (TPR) repeat protein
MKKHIFQSIFAITLALFFTSCSSDFLSKTPESTMNANAIKSANDAESLLTGAYNSYVANSYYQYDRFLITDGLSDNCYVNGDNTTAEHPIENFTFDSNNGEIQRSWEFTYASITAANAVFDNVTTMSDAQWNGTTRREQILGEASFIRALGYYNLVTQFGGVPILLSVDNGGNFYPSRNTTAEVYAQIVKDLLYAESVLPATPYNSQYGRATQGAAQALLAKTYAQMGDYTDCLTYCNKVISSGTYSLVVNFAKLWGAANKNNSESIFEIQVPSSGSPYNIYGIEIFDFATADNWPKRDIGAYDLIQAFKAAGDTLARYKSTFNWQVTTASFNMPYNAWNPNAAIPFMNKLPDYNNWAGIDNIPVIRLADIILLAAEANNQLGNTAAAITQLNRIRTRAGLAGTTATTKSALALAILNERRLELVFECTRWNDLLRADANGTINLVNLMNSQVDSYGKNLNYNVNADKHQYIFPIPLQDMQLNKNLTQNPGY